MNKYEIKQIRITNLFGTIPEHKIDLKEGGITFIHGPNGCGKTTCLKLIAAMFGWDLSTLLEIKFDLLEIETCKGDTFSVVKNHRNSKFERRLPEITISLNNKKQYVVEPVKDDMRLSPSVFEEYIPSVIRTGPREWLDRTDGARLDYSEILDRYYGQVVFAQHNAKPEWLDAFLKSINLHFIKTQRLLRVDPIGPRRHRAEEIGVAEVIQIYSNEIKESINKKLAEQAAMSQNRDRSFPQRLLSLSIDDTVSEAQIRAKYMQTEEKIQKLVQAGLIDKQDSIALPQKAFEDTERRVLWLYLEDVNNKLEVFDDLQKKIETLLEVINAKFKTKEFTVNREDGFSIHAKDNPSNALLPTQLSSGEQHQIVLFYELIFKASENSFFLIDEPEISLHVDWQRMFLEDIHKIAELGDRQFLIATHSPQIIGNYRKLAVALNEGILDV